MPHSDHVAAVDRLLPTKLTQSSLSPNAIQYVDFNPTNRGEIVGVLVVLVIIFGIGAWIAHSKAAALEKAKKDYHNSLQALTQDPANAPLKQQTLALGRVYANLTRNKKGVAMYDEVAMGNDINAACAGAMYAQAAPVSARAAVSGVEERLASLQNLQAKGLISDAEFHERRNAILSSI